MVFDGEKQLYTDMRYFHREPLRAEVAAPHPGL